MRSGTAALLKAKLELHLAAYATAASAAGVSMAVLVQPANAKIIYTPVHVVLRNPSKYDLDLNGDGGTDFVINNNSSCSFLGCLFYLDAFGGDPPDNGIEVKGGFHSAGAMLKGAGIGPKRAFDSCCYVNLAAIDNGADRGHWFNVRGRYLGLKFDIGGEIHYGWARLSVSVRDFEIVGTLSGYAYETRPNTRILAGDTGNADATTQFAERTSLGRLALGSLTRKRGNPDESK